LVVRMFHAIAGMLATSFAVSSERTREYYLTATRLSRFPVYLLPAPVDTERFDPAKAIAANRIKQYPGIKVLLVGNISPVKGVDRFVDVAGMLLRNADVRYSFLVAGSAYQNQGGYFRSLQERVKKLGIADSFHFLGEVEDMPEVLAAVDIFVCSSRAESSPMAVWEAMSMARAIVSTDVGDVARYVRIGETGSIVPHDDSSALANAIAALATNEKLRREYGSRAREVALREFEIGVIGARTAECYRRFASLDRNL
jgi:glycosyltransferase involved in cell wall biosynthesis